MTEARARLADLRYQCARTLNHHGQRTPQEVLAELPAEVAPDRNGSGGVVDELEEEVARLLGKPAAVFMLSGTMAQQIALRLHAERTGHPTVALHPTSHVVLHEGDAAARLHGLRTRPVGDSRELIALDDLEDIAEPLAALLLELPQRELGGRLPTWEQLEQQAAWARDRGAAVHLDGARLWECTPHYGRSLAEIAALFDTVYVSLYKVLGGASGCCLAGPEDLIAEAREWRHRHGGALFALWPYAASCLAGLRLRLPRIAQYVEHAHAIAEALADLDRVEVIPTDPPTNMFHLALRTTDEAFVDAALALAEDRGIWTWPGTFPTDLPSWRLVELGVGDATLTFAPQEVRELVTVLLDLAP